MRDGKISGIYHSSVSNSMLRRQGHKGPSAIGLSDPNMYRPEIMYPCSDLISALNNANEFYGGSAEIIFCFGKELAGRVSKNMNYSKLEDILGKEKKSFNTRNFGELKLDYIEEHRYDTDKNSISFQISGLEYEPVLDDFFFGYFSGLLKKVGILKAESKKDEGYIYKFSWIPAN
ncbi:MAG TPA: hypothetical protein ENN30_01720 [Candidatus Woesearchaeota archaeon]|mgnify:CR=1 FL=1|nr:hypothetical protein [Candidatus Woesearchaeota archaeon]